MRFLSIYKTVERSTPDFLAFVGGDGECEVRQLYEAPALATQ